MDFHKLGKLEFSGIRGNALSQLVQQMYEEFQEMYKVFSESCYDCLDPQNMVNHSRAESPALSLCKPWPGIFLVHFQLLYGVHGFVAFDFYQECPSVCQKVLGVPLPNCYLPSTNDGWACRVSMMVRWVWEDGGGCNQPRASKGLS